MKLKLTEKNSIIFILILAILIFLLPHFFSYFNNNFIINGSEPYYHARITSLIKNNPSLTKDPFTNIPIVFNGYYYLLAALSNIINIGILLRLIPYIFGILTVLLFFLILKKLKIKRNIRFITLILLIFSPTFIYLSTQSNVYIIGIFIMFLALWTYLNNKKWISYFLFLITPLFGLFNSIILILLLLIYLFVKRKTEIYMLFFTVLLITILLFSHLFNQLYLTNLYLNRNIIIQFFTELGAKFGFPLFYLILALFGFTITWNKKKEFLPVYLFSLTLILIFTFLANFTNIYLNFVFVFFSAFTIDYFLKVKWDINLIKNLTFLLLICGIIFSTLSYSNEITKQIPNQETVKGLQWLNQNSPSDAIIFSHHSKGFFIEYLSNRRVFMNENYIYLNNFEEYHNTSNILFYSRDLDITSSLLDKHNISYIWIDSQMLNNQVWTKEKQGLLFLFRNQEYFEEIYKNKDIQIWRYLRK